MCRLTLGRPSSPILVDKTVSPVSKDAPVDLDQVSTQCGHYCFSPSANGVIGLLLDSHFIIRLLV